MARQIVSRAPAKTASGFRLWQQAGSFFEFAVRPCGGQQAALAGRTTKAVQIPPELIDFSVISFDLMSASAAAASKVYVDSLDQVRKPRQIPRDNWQRHPWVLQTSKLRQLRAAVPDSADWRIETNREGPQLVVTWSRGINPRKPGRPLNGCMTLRAHCVPLKSF